LKFALTVFGVEPEDGDADSHGPPDDVTV